MGRLVRLDATGVKCPVPVARTKRALRLLVANDILEVTCSDRMAGIDIPCLLFQTGDELLEVRQDDSVVVVRIRKR